MGMSALPALLITASLVAGIFLGTATLPYTKDATAPWWQSSRSRFTVTIVGTIVNTEKGSITINGHGAPLPIRIAYDDSTTLLARPERVSDGRIDSIRLLVVPAEELLRPGTLVRVAMRIKEDAASPYAFAITALPL